MCRSEVYEGHLGPPGKTIYRGLGLWGLWFRAFGASELSGLGVLLGKCGGFRSRVRGLGSGVE